jgi:calcineurin-like phosphoesterase family protein
MPIWFTSDTHHGHIKVIEYCKRPFADVEAMNRALRERWNARVKPGDTVYHLGDVAMGPVENVDIFRRGVEGHVVLIKGNHDRSTSRMLKAGFNEVVNELYLELDGVRLFLHHQPMPQDLWQAKADFHLCGHVHDLWARQENIINVGVDVRDFEPKSLEELLR